MKRFITALLRRFAPTVYWKSEQLRSLDLAEVGTLGRRVVELEARVAELEQALAASDEQFNVALREVRTDERRVAELYDAVVERLRADNPLTPGR